MSVIRGVLFDLDGVLADTERLHWLAYGRVLAEFGVEVGLAEYGAQWTSTGRGPEYACRTYALPLTPDELRARKAPVYLALLHEGVTACRGARAAVERLRPSRRVAVATNAARGEVGLALGQLGLADAFHAVIAREDYGRAKPAPDAYLTAAAAVGLTPAECIVVEDSGRGVQAAVAAGMRVIAVPGELTRDNDFSACVCRLPDLDALTAALLESLEQAG